MPDVQRSVGRGRLDAVWQETRPLGTRAPFVTIGYEQRPYDDQAATTANNPATPPSDPGPDISVCETRPGMETLAIIEDELLRDVPARISDLGSRRERYAQSEVLEVSTFIIIDRSLPAAATEEEKRTFVATRLWHRLPPGGIAAVRRIDLRLAGATALLMRIWSAVPKVEI